MNNMSTTEDLLRKILEELRKLNEKMDRQWQQNVTVHAPQPSTIEPISRPPRF